MPTLQQQGVERTPDVSTDKTAKNPCTEQRQQTQK